MNATLRWMIPLTLGLLAACGPTAEVTRNDPVVPEEDSSDTENSTIAGAMGLFDMVVNDSVSADAGDNTDYRYVDVSERGSMTLRVRFLAATVDGEVSIHNDYGDILRREPITQGQQEVLVEDFNVVPGRYYVRVFAANGGADYAIGQEFEPEVAAVEVEETQNDDNDADDGDDLEEARRECERQSGMRWSRSRQRCVERSSGGSSSSGNGGSNSSSNNSGNDDHEESSSNGGNESSNNGDGSGDGGNDGDGTANDGQGNQETQVVEEEAREIRASIVNLRVRGSGTVLILRGCGSNSGLSEGSRGRVSGTGESATLIAITGSDSCEAESTAPIGTIAGASAVVF
ncbi:MAG: hypothetical protein KC561_07670 [Myxococcales bacterium]|nr:hypothetical protein [Myxococcales bacterium]